MFLQSPFEPLFSRYSLLKFKVDDYGGVVICTEGLTMEPAQFERGLGMSIHHWLNILKLRKAVWLRLPIELTVLVPVAVKYGFTYHHCTSEYLSMNLWLGNPKNNRIPGPASHYVGAGAVVLTSDSKVRNLSIFS